MLDRVRPGWGDTWASCSPLPMEGSAVINGSSVQVLNLLRGSSFIQTHLTPISSLTPALPKPPAQPSRPWSSTWSSPAFICWELLAEGKKEMNFQLGERAHYQTERWQLLQYIFIPLNSSQPSPRRAGLAVGERSLLINLVLSTAGETEPGLVDKILQELTEDGRLGVARQKAALDFSRRGTIILPPRYASIPRPVWHLPAPACLFHLGFIPPCPFFHSTPFFLTGWLFNLLYSTLSFS